MDPIKKMKEAAREGWSTFAPFETTTGAVAPALVKFAGIGGNSRVLDVGCGTGVVGVTAARVGAKVTGLDLTPALLTRAAENAALANVTVEFLEGDVEDLPFEDAEFDFVVSQFGHMFGPRPDITIREMLRVLKPGGRVSVSDTIQTMDLPQALLETEAAKAACISAAVTRDVYLESLTDAGFVDVTIESEVPYPANLGFEEALMEGLRDGHGIPEEVIKAAAASMVSIAVTATKAAV